MTLESIVWGYAGTRQGCAILISIKDTIVVDLDVVMRKLLQLKTRFNKPFKRIFQKSNSQRTSSSCSMGHNLKGMPFTGLFHQKSTIASILDTQSTKSPLKRQSHKVSRNPNKQSNTNLFRHTVPSRSPWPDCPFRGRDCPNSRSTLRGSKYVHRSILRTPVSSLSSQPCQNRWLLLSYGNDQIPVSSIHCS